MTDYLGVLALVASRLDGAGVPYMVSGSTAVGFYAQPRMTRDIDLVVDVSPAGADGLAAAFGDGFYADEDAIRRAVVERRMVNVIHLASMVKIDLIVRKDDPYRRTEFNRRRPYRLGATTVWMVSPEDLVLSKLLWARDTGSELQLRDARALLAGVDSLDGSYLEHWADELNVAVALREARS